MAGSKQKYSAEEVAEAVRYAKGLLSVAARNLNVTLQTMYNYRDRYKAVQQAISDAREGMIDYTEGKLYEQIRDGNTTAIIFYLKTQAKHRGYVEKVETEHSGKIEHGISFDEAIKILNDD